MSILKTKFGNYDNKDVFLYTLDNGKGLVAEIINYGGIIRSLKYNGVDVVLGRDSLEEYLNNEGYFGAIIGRNSNRIANAKFEISGEIYNLSVNNGVNNLHSGISCFAYKVWDANIIDGDEPSVILSLFSPDGEGGFPGNVNAIVTYTVTKENSIKIHYEADTDKDTPINMTNHSYFNLNGHSSGTIDKHTLWLNSDFYTPNTIECMPYGEILKVQETPFELSGKRTFEESFDSSDEQITMFGGIDHNFVLNGKGFRLCGMLTGDKTGIKMEVYTDCPGIQIYTGNVIEQGRVCKEGNLYPVHGAVCLETQVFPNALKYSHFPSSVIKKGEKYDALTEYKFI